MEHPQDFASALAAGPRVLNGGLATDLEATGRSLDGGLWSARLLQDDPEALVEAHRAYFEAGADVATTASYQASALGFARYGDAEARAAELLALSVRLARRAARECRRPSPRWVAASVGPYGAALADGSEYRGRYGLSAAQLDRFHRPRLEALAAAAPDVLALETLPDTDEARVLLTAVRGLGLPVWVSFTVDGALTRAGQPLDEAFALAAECEEVVAVGVNCCAPGDVDAAVRIAARTSGLPAVAYPNSGEGWDAEAGSWTGPGTFRPDSALCWLQGGARLIGGCCRVGPDDVARLGAVLHDR